MVIYVKEVIKYNKMQNITQELIPIYKHILGGLYSRGAYIWGRLYSEGILF